MYRQWTSQDVLNFKEFVRRRGGRVVETKETMNGGFIFHVVAPTQIVVSGSVQISDDWASKVMKAFEDKGRIV